VIHGMGVLWLEKKLHYPRRISKVRWG
jgi:hypothetical protein